MTGVTVEQLEAEVPAVEKKPAPKRGKKALDLSKPYATVHGVTKARYKQDGAFFDLDGKPCEL